MRIFIIVYSGRALQFRRHGGVHRNRNTASMQQPSATTMPPCSCAGRRSTTGTSRFAELPRARSSSSCTVTSHRVHGSCATSPSQPPSSMRRRQRRCSTWTEKRPAAVRSASHCKLRRRSLTSHVLHRYLRQRFCTCSATGVYASRMQYLCSWRRRATSA